MSKKISLLLTACLGCLAPGFSFSTDIVIYGADLKDWHPLALKHWDVISCPNLKTCTRLTDPLANCEIKPKSIRCGNFTYHCNSGSSWHIIDKGYNKDYFCTTHQPKDLPPTTVGGSNF